MIWAIYRIHYGIDFLEPSINSIIEEVDKVFIFYSKDQWIKSTHINYKKKIINFPKNPENVESFLISKFSNNKKIIFKNYECKTPDNQFGKLFNLACSMTAAKPKYALFMEPDMIFGDKQLKFMKLELNLSSGLSQLSLNK